MKFWYFGQNPENNYQPVITAFNDGVTSNRLESNQNLELLFAFTLKLLEGVIPLDHLLWFVVKAVSYTKLHGLSRPAKSPGCFSIYRAKRKNIVISSQ